ncbi:MAG: hypothetical protein M1829_002138 [Trizodia sp. TS-e1964]|nr:MAG: hypothetical protein M1829_002138 [Trizodia sp. TS-e1964]
MGGIQEYPGEVYQTVKVNIKLDACTHKQLEINGASSLKGLPTLTPNRVAIPPKPVARCSRRETGRMNQGAQQPSLSAFLFKLGVVVPQLTEMRDRNLAPTLNLFPSKSSPISVLKPATAQHQDTRSMNEALSSILCSEQSWSYQVFFQCIIFNADGTGEVYCNFEMCWLLALAFEWKTLPPPPPPPPTTPAAQRPCARSPQLLGHLNVEITLARRLPPGIPEKMRQHGTYLTEKVLRDAAFRPKPFCLRMEKGVFMEPGMVGVEGMGAARYTLRLLFDKSPFPPREEWWKPNSGPDGGPDGISFWEKREFVARRARELEGRGAAMNDPRAVGWSSCAVS